jgi:hypothetical protein
MSLLKKFPWKQFIKSIYLQEKGLVWTGFVGIMISFACGIYFFIHGSNDIPPEGKFSNLISFDLAIAVYVLTTAALLTVLQLSTSFQKKILIYPLIVTSLVAYISETVQNLRGINARFTQTDLPFSFFNDLITTVAAMLTLLFIIFTVIIFRTKDKKNQLLLLSVKYSCFAVFLGGILSGLWMSMEQGRWIGDEGNIMIIHFIGFHSLQTIPIIGWLLDHSSVRHLKAKKIIHVTGITWIMMILLLFIQTAIGKSIYDISIYLVFIVLFLLIWMISFLWSFKQTVSTNMNK